MTETTLGTTTSALSTSVTPDLTVIDGVITTTSLQVAEHFGKTHKSVLRAIRNLECSTEYHQRNFAPMVVTVEIGSGATRDDPAYRLTRDGFVFLAMGFTGKEAAQWKEAYITAFNKMESELVKLTNPALPTVITPAQCQHLRELVALVVESGKQTYGETWTRLHRKMQVNSYLALKPEQFNAACEYLRGKMDGESIAAIAMKHFPQVAQLNAPKPTEPQRMNLDIKTLCACILGGMIDPRAFMELAYAVNQHQFKLACANTRRGYGQEVSDKIKAGMDDADLYAITVAATMETWMRTAQPQRMAA